MATVDAAALGSETAMGDGVAAAGLGGRAADIGRRPTISSAAKLATRGARGGDTPCENGVGGGAGGDGKDTGGGDGDRGGDGGGDAGGDERGDGGSGEGSGDHAANPLIDQTLDAAVPNMASTAKPRQSYGESRPGWAGDPAVTGGSTEEVAVAPRSCTPRTGGFDAAVDSGSNARPGPAPQ